MDDLDKQLAELQLLNSTDLPPNPTGQQHGSPEKKVAPKVPPKPKKPQPQVPQSYAVRQNVEPAYASRLQHSGGPPPNFYSNVAPRPMHSQSPSNSSTLPLGASMSQSSLYANSDHYANIRVDVDRQAQNQYQNVQGLTQRQPMSHLPQRPHDGAQGPHGGAPQQPSRMSDYVRYGNVPNMRDNRQQLVYSNVMHAPHQGNVYGNLPRGNNLYANGDDLPPPPPELEASHMGEYGSEPEEFPPPPSPVSSSYSELRRATQPGQDYNNYRMGPFSDTESLYGISSQSSTYESIYEPINPRPPSQMSSRSNYSLYAPYSGGSQMSGPSQSASRIGNNKEHEVDTLTNLLVQGMGNEPEGDYYGVCVKCHMKIVGENTGCTAMDEIYHTKCFTCHCCAINLQGKPFYCLDGKPFCKEDYMNTLEKCCVCLKPILDRILRATGKPYHPKCFRCVICGKSLDGIPFTVDATNQIHCIEDFHKKFAPKCCVCMQPIMPEPGQEETIRVVALDRSFHIQCYKCEDCGLVLSSEAEGRGCYPLDDHVLCRTCNAKRVQALTNHMTTEL